MKRLYIIVVGLFLIYDLLILSLVAEAQNSIACGDVVAGEIAQHDEIHEYKFQGEINSQIWLVGVVDATYIDSLDVDVRIYASNGRELANPVAGDLIYASAFLPENGEYSVIVQGFGYYGGRYSLHVSCVDPTGVVNSNSRYIENIQCGNILESRFEKHDEIHYYFIAIDNNTELEVTGEVLLGYESTLDVDVRIYGLNGREFANEVAGDSVTVTTLVPESGIYIVLAQGFGAYGGQYVLYVQCTLENGNVIEPGDVPHLSEKDSSTGYGQMGNEFSGFGFPGISPVDFSGGIEIPLQLGQVQIAPLSRDIPLYTYEAESGEMRVLSLSRLSGNISVGVAVIKRDTDELLFFGAMPSSDKLTVELAFPSSGIYLIGLFRVDTANQSDTSGAVQINLE